MRVFGEGMRSLDKIEIAYGGFGNKCDSLWKDKHHSTITYHNMSFGWKDKHHSSITYVKKTSYYSCSMFRWMYFSSPRDFVCMNLWIFFNKLLIIC